MPIDRTSTASSPVEKTQRVPGECSECAWRERNETRDREPTPVPTAAASRLSGALNNKRVLGRGTTFPGRSVVC